MTVWHSIGHPPSCWRGREGLRAVTQVAALHVLHYIAAHVWPPEVAHYQVHCLPSAAVTSYWGFVVEGSHYLVSELTIWGDVDSTSIEYQAILFPPFLMM